MWNCLKLSVSLGRDVLSTKFINFYLRCLIMRMIMLMSRLLIFKITNYCKLNFIFGILLVLVFPSYYICVYVCMYH